VVFTRTTRGSQTIQTNISYDDRPHDGIPRYSFAFPTTITDPDGSPKFAEDKLYARFTRGWEYDQVGRLKVARTGSEAVS
jgi:hypothetical protein